jgi:hypothetical protein
MGRAYRPGGATTAGPDPCLKINGAAGRGRVVSGAPRPRAHPLFGITASSWVGSQAKLSRPAEANVGVPAG